MRKLRKVKFDPKARGIFLAWEDWDEGSGVLKDWALQSSEKPKTELLEAILHMRSHLRQQCELDAAYEEQFRIRGLTVTEDKDGIRGLVITGIRELKNSDTPLVLNSPHFVEDSENELAKGVFSSQCGEDLDEVARLAFGYIDGDRQQGQLDLEAVAAVRKAQADIAMHPTTPVNADLVAQADKKLARGMRSGLDKAIEPELVALGDEELEVVDEQELPAGGAPLTGAESAATGQVKISN